MKSMALVPRRRFGFAASTGLFAVTLFITFGTGVVRAQNEPILVQDAVSYQKLIPILPEPPGWGAEKAEGSSDDVGGFKITNVHRDYPKGEGVDAPTASISILDSVANPDYVEATTNGWNQHSETPEGYSKSVTIDGNAGFEAYDKDQKQATLWVMLAKRYFVTVELQQSGAEGTSGVDQKGGPEKISRNQKAR